MKGESFRLSAGGRVNRDRVLRFTWNGRAYEGLEGDSAAVARTESQLGSNIQGLSTTTATGASARDDRNRTVGPITVGDRSRACRARTLTMA